MVAKTAFLPVLLFLQALPCFCQDHETSLAQKLSKQDRYEYFLDKSRKQKRQAWMALIGGPVLTATGVYIASKGGPTLSGAGGGWVTVRNNDSRSLIGSAIGVLGIATTLSSLPLFIAASKNKRQAALLLKDQPTSFLNRPVDVPGLTLTLCF